MLTRMLPPQKAAASPPAMLLFLSAACAQAAAHGSAGERGRGRAQAARVRGQGQGQGRGQGQGQGQGQGKAAQPSSSSQTGRRRWMVTRGCARPPPCALICSSRLIRRSSVTCRPPRRASAAPARPTGYPGGGVRGRAYGGGAPGRLKRRALSSGPQHPGSRARDCICS